ncbi:hypothetical protein [Serratia quinivorans]|uniref:hypothetical protein n=1 Tax=Serratia quinivorans TaxID=137545 RepID=UPI0021776D01|nr:hypothetical protein [Serratia quinivorans]CAI1595356.1 Uncharacterised protein [Serratia quinivorans]CAI1675055.1 Uncharacterised protein [Serratia quinivorans]
MKKMLILAIPVLAICFLTPWIIYTGGERKNPPFTCESNFSLSAFWKNDKNIPIVINADLKLSFINNENGILSAMGNVERNGNIYFLARRLNFHTSQTPLGNMKKVTFTKETAHISDNTPDEIWKTYFLPEQLGVDFYADTKVLNDNTMLIRAFSTPYSICVIPE